MKFSGFIFMAVFVPDPAKRSSQRKCHRKSLFQSPLTINDCKRKEIIFDNVSAAYFSLSGDLYLGIFKKFINAPKKVRYKNLTIWGFFNEFNL